MRPCVHATWHWVEEEQCAADLLPVRAKQGAATTRGLMARATDKTKYGSCLAESTQ